LPTYKRPWRTHAKYIPTVKGALVPPQFDGKFFFRQKFR
jgi:hypothetical protein